MQALPKHEPAIHRSSPSVSLFHPVRAPDASYDRLLLDIPACDPLGDSFGANLRLVLDGCLIVANNRPGYLVRKRAVDSEQIHWPGDPNTLVPAGDYYYHLSESPHEDYLVVSDFNAWPFPPTIPAHWQSGPSSIDVAEVAQSSMSVAVREQDGHCIVTMYKYAIKNARLIPEEHDAWFRAYGMVLHARMSASYPGVNNVANGVALRADVRSFFDHHFGFVFYPAAGANKFCAYLLHWDHKYRQELHRREVEMPERVAREFLYARFAYNIIGCLAKTWLSKERSVPIPPRVLHEMALLQAEESQTKPGRTPAHSSLQSSEGSEDDGCVNMDGEVSHRSALSWVGIEADDERWREGLTAACPELAELPEVDNPPNFPRSGNHLETPRMLRLMEQYLAQHPEVRAVVGPTASEDDVRKWDAMLDHDDGGDDDGDSPGPAGELLPATR